MIRGYHLNESENEFKIESSKGNSSIDLSDEVNVLNYIGSIQSLGGEKCTGKVFIFCLFFFR